MLFIDMQQYQKDYLKSRWKKKTDKILCEYPWCKLLASEIHHITSSYRGKRTNKEDWIDLIAVCRTHHNEIHKHNNFTTRQSLLSIVLDLLSKKWQI